MAVLGAWDNHDCSCQLTNLLHVPPILILYAQCVNKKWAHTRSVIPLRQLIEHNQSLRNLNCVDDNDINDVCCDKMCEWSYRIVNFCKCHRESLDNYLHRFLLTKDGQAALHNRNIYQLVAMTWLHSAIKYMSNKVQIPKSPCYMCYNGNFIHQRCSPSYGNYWFTKE